MLIVGGGPAGAAAAVYAARKGHPHRRRGRARFGGQVNDTLAIETTSRCSTDGPKFAAALERPHPAYGVDIMNLQRAESSSPPPRSPA